MELIIVYYFTFQALAYSKAYLESRIH